MVSSQLGRVQAPPGSVAERWLHSCRLEYFYLEWPNPDPAACSAIGIWPLEIFNSLPHSFEPVFSTSHKDPEKLLGMHLWVDNVLSSPPYLVKTSFFKVLNNPKLHNPFIFNFGGLPSWLRNPQVVYWTLGERGWCVRYPTQTHGRSISLRRAKNNKINQNRSNPKPPYSFRFEFGGSPSWFRDPLVVY
jgi:hypothetical protein